MIDYQVMEAVAAKAHKEAEDAAKQQERDDWKKSTDDLKSKLRGGDAS